MSKLRTLLGNDHPLFTQTLVELERATGNAGVDTRLLADITERAHVVMRALSIDPADTSAEELYHSLNSAIKNGHAEELLSTASYVLLELEEQVVSFNFFDTTENAHHGLAFAERKNDHAVRNLRLEILKRYAEHDRTDNVLVHDLAAQADIKVEQDVDFVAVDSLLSKAERTNESQPKSVLMIGDIFSDAFIELDQEVARIDSDKDGSKRLSLPFGSKPPYKNVKVIDAVGPSPNAAVACARLGLDVSLMAWMGDDTPGKDSLKLLNIEGIDASNMVIERDKKSNYYYVLRYGADRTILVKDEDYTYAWLAPKKVPDWIYLSLISEDSWQLHEDLTRYLKEYPDIKLAFQPGTFHFKWGVEKLRDIYKRSHIVVMNREEAVEVSGGSYENLSDLAKRLHVLGPKYVVITDGPNGSYASYEDKIINIPNYPDLAAPVDRTGAGDAFASTIVAALMLGKTMDEALTWAPINSMNVVQHLGAQKGLLRQRDIEQYLEIAPNDYQPRNL